MDDTAELATLASLRSNPVAATNHVDVEVSMSLDDRGPALTDLHLAAQRGDVSSLERLVKIEKTSVNERAADGTTALHWAAFHNHYEACLFLIDNGADINARGGFKSATPLMWACRNGFVYIARLLLQRGAVYNETDEQGFSPLHLAVHSSNVLLVIYFVHEYASFGVDPVDLDLRRIPLIWAACQGDHMTLDVLVKAGANVHAADAEGMTPLHWATVSKSLDCLQILLRAGADPFVRNTRESTCFDIAREVDGENVLQQALRCTGRLASGTLRPRRFSERETELITFFLPFVVAKVDMVAVSYLYWWASIPIIVGSVYASRVILKRYVLYNKWPGRLAMLQSTLMAGIFCGLTFWVLVQFFVDLVPMTSSAHPLLTVLFIGFALTGLGCYGTALFMDPGLIKTGSEAEVCGTINELLDSGEYDTLNFCYATFVRIPARAHYDKIIGDVVAKYDHYCPWLYNSVGLRNHRLFVAFLTAISTAISVLAVLVVLTIREQPMPMGRVLSQVPETTALYIVCTPIFLWIQALMFTQWAQVARASTTYDIAQQKQASETFSSLPADHPRARGRTPAPVSPLDDENSSHHHHRHKSPLKVCAALLGLSQIKMTFQAVFGKERHPYDHGLKQNCNDFWCSGGSMFHPDPRQGSLGGRTVDYFALSQPTYSLPATVALSRADKALRQLT